MEQVDASQTGRLSIEIFGYVGLYFVYLVNGAELLYGPPEQDLSSTVILLSNTAELCGAPWSSMPLSTYM